MMTQPPPQPIPPETVLIVKLQAQQWNGVMNALGEAPWRVAQPLIQAITEQFQQQTSQPPGEPNGLDQLHAGVSQ